MKNESLELDFLSAHQNTDRTQKLINTSLTVSLTQSHSLSISLSLTEKTSAIISTDMLKTYYFWTVQIYLGLASDLSCLIFLRNYKL